MDPIVKQERRASASDPAELAEWIALYEANRTLMLDGNLVRVDSPTEPLTAFRRDRAGSEPGDYPFASEDRSDLALLGRLGLPGLDPLDRYRVSSVLVERAPSGPRPPRWWASNGTSRRSARTLRVGMAPASLQRRPMQA